jgi:hypothetical protein
MDPDPDPSIIKHKNTVLLILYDILSFKNDVNVHSKCNKQKNFLKNC